ncbi:class I SAM-dependent methyltransferase [Streptomyces varsoviensis]|uniref:class I SAM-dependent methyltransferase n=1 Tax=Streptomyces varsoviensis TaxID=67373 RepID=UPI000AABEFD2|nr:class I SAM-dependent methyltransferase [Streptomyces varsoviensis]
MREPIADEARAGTSWWDPEGGFFGDLYREADDSLHTFFGDGTRLGERTAAEVDGVIRRCELAAGSRVLDCPCGYGRHSVGLARRGMDVIGLDINPGFLDAARDAAAQAGVPVSLVRGDMRRLPELAPVDAVINMFYSFGFFTPEEDLKVLREFHRVLKPSGRLLMHTMVTVPALTDGRIPAEERRRLASGRTLVSRRGLDPRTGRENGAWMIVDDDGTEHPMAPYSVRIYTPQEFADLCLEAGFASVTSYGDWEGAPYDDASASLIVVADRGPNDTAPSRRGRFSPVQG